jgi:NAD(P)-dependent dehydrogenase (short-subunit alcohol dehydrogenase family)
MTDKIALVTGGGTGIGRAAALALTGIGYTVIVCGRRKAPLDEAVAAIEAKGGKGEAMVCDVSRPHEVRSMFNTIRETHGRLDFLFNNAGMGGPPVPLEDLAFEDWQKVVGVNLTAMFLCTQQAFRIMKDQQPMGGRIVNNGSISAHTPRPNTIAYTSTKHGVTGITKSSALDGRKYNIAVGQIDIGNAESQMADKMKKGMPQPDGSIKPEATMPLDHVGQAIAMMANMPLDSNVLTLTIKATKMPFEGRG